jgi:hypothetical protein
MIKCEGWPNNADREWRGKYRVFVGKLEGKRPIVGPRYRWEGNIKMDLLGLGVWSGTSLLRIGAAGSHVCVW